MFVKRTTAALLVIIFFLACCCAGLISYTLTNNSCRYKTGKTVTEEPKTSVDKVTSAISSKVTETKVSTSLPTYNAWEDFRLSRSVYPLKYNLLLWPDLQKGTFTGKVNITVDVSDYRTHFIVHSVKLNITKSGIYKNGTPLDVKKRFDYQPNEFFVLETEKVEPGLYVLSYEFKGSLLNGILGFYRSKYFDPLQNATRYLATSKFQPTSARKAFPCFDEPAFKSNFTISLVHDKEMIALSNMPVNNQTEFEGTDMLLTTFEESVPMVTYLACFIVCDFKYTSAEISKEREVRVYSTPHQVQNTLYSLDLAQKLLLKYEEYFQIDYPLPKQDLIAIPDFVSGAMEHWGLITFRETNLLFEENQTSPALKQRVATVVAHELVHMWFGNLVTMEWWDDLWLNEGFASYFEYKGVEWAEPEWNMMDQFLIQDLHPVMELDAGSNSHPIVQTVSHPAEITEIFDMISYNKGASVIRMLEYFMGSESFRRGISSFLVRYKYGSATTEDLWRELSAVNSTNTNKDISEIMNTWTRQKGFPVIRVRRDPEDADAIFVSQEIFLKDPKKRSADNSVWSVPLSFRNSNGDEDLIWLHDKKEKRIRLNISSSQWWKFNTEQKGYYLVNYDPLTWQRFSKVLQEDHEAISVSDRTNLLFDAFLLASAGYIEYDVAFSLTRYLQNETHLTPWFTAIGSVITLTDLLEFTEVDRYVKKYIQQIVTPIYNKLGWIESNSHLENLLRSKVLSLACRSGNADCLKIACNMFLKWIENKTEVPSNVRMLVYGYGMSELGNNDYWYTMWERFLKEPSPQERRNLMYGLAQVRRPHLLYRYLEYAMDESKIRSQDFFTCLMYIAANSVGRPIVWDFLRYSWPKLIERFTVNDRSLGRSVKVVCDQFTTDYHLQEMKDFFERYPDAGAGARARLQTLEVVESNIRWLKLYKQKVADWLSKEIES
uniref:Aminopeptidase n=1 Tax=Hadrurus spadix TaxID=141984 RepID=A0A1W7RAI9_9SCOR